MCAAAHGRLRACGSLPGRECVTHVAFSHDSLHLAVAHLDRCVCLYRYAHRHNDRTYPQESRPGGPREELSAVRTDSSYSVQLGRGAGHVHINIT